MNKQELAIKRLDDLSRSLEEHMIDKISIRPNTNVVTGKEPAFKDGLFVGQGKMTLYVDNNPLKAWEIATPADPTTLDDSGRLWYGKIASEELTKYPGEPGDIDFIIPADNGKLLLPPPELLSTSDWVGLPNVATDIEVELGILTNQQGKEDEQ